MNSRHLKLFQEMEQDHNSHSLPDTGIDKILIFDGLNLFFRSFSVNPSVDDTGYPMGGVIGTLLSIGYTIRQLNPTRVFICFDGKGGSQRRKKIYGEYKSNRTGTPKISSHLHLSSEEVIENFKYQLNQVFKYLEFLPITTFAVENIEADDSIAYITQQVLTDSKICIVSTDKDFIQLVDHRISVWSPVKKVMYHYSEIQNQWNVPPHNLVFVRSVEGDSSDNVSGIKGLAAKTLISLIPELLGPKMDLNQFIRIIETRDFKGKKGILLKENIDIIQRNYKLMQLNDVNISGYAKQTILQHVNSPVPKFQKLEFLKLYTRDNINSTLKNPSSWLDSSFKSLVRG